MFKEIKGYETYGLIDEYGNIKAHCKDKIRKIHLANGNTPVIKIFGKNLLIKNLVAMSFMTSFDSEKENIIVMDSDPSNTHISNLKVASKKILDMKCYPSIVEMRSKGMLFKEIAAVYKVSSTTIKNIIRDYSLQSESYT